jgi:hypothetical protein
VNSARVKAVLKFASTPAKSLRKWNTPQRAARKQTTNKHQTKSPRLVETNVSVLR